MNIFLYGERLALKHLPKIYGKPKPRPHDHPLSTKTCNKCICIYTLTYILQEAESLVTTFLKNVIDIKSLFPQWNSGGLVSTDSTPN